MHYSTARGLSFGRSHLLDSLFDNSQQFTKYTVYRWNQQLSLSAALDEWKPSADHLNLRYGLAAITVAVGALLFLRKRYEVAIIACMMWFFFLYGRGHEYHGTLYVPMLLCLYTLPGGRYRGWPLVAIGVLVALPTVYGLFDLQYGFPNRGPFDTYPNDLMLANSPPLYFLFLWHKPLCAVMLFSLMLVKEWPYDMRAIGASLVDLVRRPVAAPREAAPVEAGS